MKSNPPDTPTGTLYAGFEGGAVYTLEQDGCYCVVLDESTVADMLSPDDLAGVQLVKTLAFATRAERTAYLLQRFGPARPARGR